MSAKCYASNKPDMKYSMILSFVTFVQFLRKKMIKDTQKNFIK